MEDSRAAGGKILRGGTGATGAYRGPREGTGATGGYRGHGGVPGPREGYRAMARYPPVARAGAQEEEQEEQQEDTDPAQGLGTADDSRTASHARHARHGHATRNTTSRFGGGP